MAQPVQCGHCGDPIPANSSPHGQAQHLCDDCYDIYLEYKTNMDDCDEPAISQ